MLRYYRKGRNGMASVRRRRRGRFRDRRDGQPQRPVFGDKLWVSNHREKMPHRRVGLYEPLLLLSLFKVGPRGLLGAF